MKSKIRNPKSKMDIQVFPDKESLSRAAAEMFAQIARAAVAARGRFLAALSGGGTPQRLYELLAQSPYRAAVPWAQTHLFWGDERLVPPDDPGSNYGQVAQLWREHLLIPGKNYRRVLGESAAATAVTHYAHLLRQFAEDGRVWPRFDLVLLGMGGDGHTASLFPGPIPPAETSQPVIAVTADYDGRPAHRITLTPLVFNDARHVIFLVAGENKAAALTAVLAPKPDPIQCPAARIQPHTGRLTWLLDKAAASQTP